MVASKKYLKMGFEFTWYVLPSLVRWSWDLLISPLYLVAKLLLRRLTYEVIQDRLLYCVLYVGGLLGILLTIVGVYVLATCIVGGAF